MRQDSTPAPEGETPPCQCGHALNQHLLAGGHCEQRGCACRLFVIPLPPARERGEATPAPASGEEELAWLRIRDVHQPQSGKSRCCGTWELVEPALLIAVRERDWILEAFARLTRELAGARGVVAQRSIETGQAMAERDAARAEAARMRDKVNDLMARLGRMCGDA